MCYTHTHTHTHTHTRTHQAPATICSWSRGSIALSILLPFPTFLPTILLNIPRPIAFVFQHKRRRVSIVSSEGAGKSRGFTNYGRHTPPSNDPAHGVWGNRKARGDAVSVRGRRPRPPVMDHRS